MPAPSTSTRKPNTSENGSPKLLTLTHHKESNSLIPKSGMPVRQKPSGIWLQFRITEKMQLFKMAMPLIQPKELMEDPHTNPQFNSTDRDFLKVKTIRDNWSIRNNDEMSDNHRVIYNLIVVYLRRKLLDKYFLQFILFHFS